MTIITLIYVAVWALCVIPIGRWARHNLREDREYEGDELDPISREGAAALGLLWAAGWPLAVVFALVYGVVKLIGLAMPEAD